MQDLLKELILSSSGEKKRRVTTLKAGARLKENESERDGLKKTNKS